jgi:hypothetical protein
VKATTRVHLDNTRYEYLDPCPNKAVLHKIDPSLVLITEHLTKRQHISQIETTYKQTDTPACRTLESYERHAKVSDELVTKRFGIGPIRAQ